MQYRSNYNFHPFPATQEHPQIFLIQITFIQIAHYLSNQSFLANFEGSKRITTQAQRALRISTDASLKLTTQKLWKFNTQPKESNYTLAN